MVDVCRTVCEHSAVIISASLNNNIRMLSADPNGKMWNRLRASIGEPLDAAVKLDNMLVEVVKCQ
jgi:hypothetical protein